MKSLKNMLEGATSRGVLLCKKYAPDIFLGVGVVGVVTATVLACKATTKASKVMEKLNSGLDDIRSLHNGEVDLPEGETYSEKDYQHDLTIAYANGGMELLKVYAPAIGLGMASMTLIFASHHILKKRNLAVVAAYTGLQKAFDEYRARVVKSEGEEKDREYRYGVKTEKVKETVTDEKGKEKTQEKEVTTVSPISQYARFFDEASIYWSKDPEKNLLFLKSQQNWFNDRLKIKGHVFLNEVYDALDIPRTSAGAVVGWVKGNKDSFVDFNIFDGKDPRKRAFVNGYERCILMDFNVDGVIYDLI